jgi:cytochrome c
MKKAAALLFVLCVLVPGSRSLAAAGDPERGAVIFERCTACHRLDGRNRVGPTLHAVVGRNAGSVPGFRYSDALKSSGIVWTEESLAAFLENPRARVPETRMTFPGLPSPVDRQDVIAFLKVK